MDFAFNELKLNRVELRAVTENIPSNNVAKKFNFKFEACYRQAVIAKSTGKIHDENVYSLLREEYILK